MSATAWAEGSTLTRIERSGFKAAVNLVPTFHSKTWCDQGHVMDVDAPACSQCRNATAVIASDLLEQLHLGLIRALEPQAPYGMTYAEQLAEAMGGRR